MVSAYFGVIFLMTFISTIPIAGWFVSWFNTTIGTFSALAVFIISMGFTVMAIISTLAVKNQISDYRLWNYTLLPVVFPMTSPVIFIHNIITAST